MCLRRRMCLPFALVDRYDPKQVCQSIVWCMETYRKNHSDTPVVGLENLRTALLSRLQEAIDGFD